MFKAFTIALSLTIAAPLALSTVARAEDSMRHVGGDMQKHGKAMSKSHHRHATHHRMMHTNDRGAMDREESKVTSDLNQREFRGYPERRDH